MVRLTVWCEHGPTGVSMVRLTGVSMIRLTGVSMVRLV